PRSKLMKLTSPQSLRSARKLSRPMNDRAANRRCREAGHLRVGRRRATFQRLVMFARTNRKHECEWHSGERKSTRPNIYCRTDLLPYCLHSMSLRLFAALEIPDDVAERLLALMKGVSGASWRPRENLHLTLRFFGEVQEPVADEIDAALGEIAIRHAPFEL